LFGFFLGAVNLCVSGTINYAGRTHLIEATPDGPLVGHI
jgi:hypothetical protein